ncbi:MAG: hypothetical protein GXO47_07640 [Chlorobi bacterium]|nr:hypothetical protein [Chlorobiota bacterium]
MRSFFLFNPTSEMAVANDTVSYTPPSFLRKFEEDVAPLMGFAGRDSDFLISEKDKDGSFRNFWKRNNVVLPEYVSFQNFTASSGNVVFNPVPWGWNKSVIRELSSLKEYFSPSFGKLPVAVWKEHYKDFYSRETSVRFANEVKRRISDDSFMSVPYVPRIFDSVSDIEMWESKNSPPYVFKTPWSSSGRGLYPVTDAGFVKRSRIWLKSRMKQQGKIIIEPWLNKLQDISFQFYFQPNGCVKFLGLNYFEAGSVGEFKKEFIGMPEELKKKQESFGLPEGWETDAAGLLKQVLFDSRFGENYCGPAGIDGIIFSDDNGKVRVHPCIEINFRFNMGYVNLKLKDILHPESKGEWTIKQFKPGLWRSFVTDNISNHPVVMKDGKILKGFLPLVPWGREQLYGAWAEVGV